jgi:hypothetical protein
MAMPKVVERFVDGLGGGAFFHQELRFAQIGVQHAIAYESAAVSH